MTLIADVFSKLPSPKKVIRQMSEKSRFRIPFYKQHTKVAVAILTAVLLPYFLITLNIIQLEKLYVSAM